MDLDFSQYAKPHVDGGSAEEPGIRPNFFIKAVHSPRKSETEGRPIYDELEYVELMFVGDKSTVVVERVNDSHRRRWPAAYAQFKAGMEQIGSGTPLEQWPVMSTGRIHELKALKIHTVEDLAGLTEAGILRLGMGARELVNQAKAFIDSAKSGAFVSQLTANNERLTAENAAMAQQLADLARRVQAMESDKGDAPYVDEDVPTITGSVADPERRGPGRPRKTF